jgi:hypothetical protein
MADPTETLQALGVQVRHRRDTIAQGQQEGLA